MEWEPYMHAPVWSGVAERFVAPYADADMRLVGSMPDNTPPEQIAYDPPLRELEAGRTVVFVDEPPFDTPLPVAGPCVHRLHVAERPDCADEFFARPAGWPVFFVRRGLAERDPVRLQRLVQRVEGLYCRHRILPHMAPGLTEAWPQLRCPKTRHAEQPIHRPVHLEALEHLYANAAMLAPVLDLRHAAGAMAGVPAVIVAAGPDLDHHIDHLRRAAGRVCIIAINRTLKGLLAAGITPHICIVDDQTWRSRKTFAALPPSADLSRTLLACHVHSHCPAPSTPFGAVGFFGHARCVHEVPPLPKRVRLARHISVTTAAWSLALHLGMDKVTFVGAQLGAPTNMTPYARDAVLPGEQIEGVTAQWAVALTREGRAMHTRVDYLDTALWLSDAVCEAVAAGEVRRVVNTATDSLLEAPCIEREGAPRWSATVDANGPHVALLSGPREVLDRAALARWLRGERDFWQRVAALAQGKEGAGGGEMGPAALRAHFDALGVTHLAQRMDAGRPERKDAPDAYTEARFHALVRVASQQGLEPAVVQRGYRLYFDCVARMAEELVQRLDDALTRLGQ